MHAHAGAAIPVARLFVIVHVGDCFKIGEFLNDGKKRKSLTCEADRLRHCMLLKVRLNA